jgi:F-type H+-transporting ATPase subunit epsilon
MWRQAAKVSYLQYSNEMATLLRECLKEPYRTEAMKAGQVWMRERVFQNGVETEKFDINDLKTAFGSAKKQ